MEDKSGTSSESSNSSFEEITSMFEPTSKKPKVCLHLNFIPDAERLFSAVVLIKSKSRNRLNTDTVTALLLAKEGVKDLSPTEDCTKFALHLK